MPRSYDTNNIVFTVISMLVLVSNILDFFHSAARCTLRRLQEQLETQNAVQHDGEFRSRAALRRLERRAKEAESLEEELEVCRRRLEKLESERTAASDNVQDATERIEVSFSLASCLKKLRAVCNAQTDWIWPQRFLISDHG